MANRTKTADVSLPAVRLSVTLKEKAEKKAAEMGISLSEYIRYLIATDK